MTQATSVVPFERIASAIYLIRGERVMMDADLATLYGVETKALKRAVLRNRTRFPKDFMFVLERQEVVNLRRQSGTSSSWGGLRYFPMAFTEQGVAMLSCVLRSERAIAVNIAIMRVFVRLREFLTSQVKLAKRLRVLEQEVAEHHKSIGTLFDAMQQLTNEHPPAIGFQYVRGDGPESSDGKPVREKRTKYRTLRKRRLRRIA
jgi:hypothetical protein